MIDEIERQRDALIAIADELEHESELVEAVNAARRWDDLTVAEHRALIRLALERVDVARGRAAVDVRCAPFPRRRDSLREQTPSRACVARDALRRSPTGAGRS